MKPDDDAASATGFLTTVIGGALLDIAPSIAVLFFLAGFFLIWQGVGDE